MGKPYVYLFLLISVFTVESVSAQNRWYTGYYFRGYSGWGPYGVRGRIYTLDPYVPQYNSHFQWVTIILSYDRRYWLQLGYHETPPYHGLLFFWEVFDAVRSDHNDIQTPTPTLGKEYSYVIVSLKENEWYKFQIYEVYDGQVGLIWQNEISVNPYAAVDLQSFVETTTNIIRINGTHFRNLRYYYVGRPWTLWSTHVPHADYPYQLEEISNYEFRASGGG